MRFISFAGGAAMAAAVCSIASASLIVNGSFEESPLDPGGSFIALGGGNTSITGWTTLLGGVDYIGGYWTAAEGSRSLDLNNTSAGGIEQSFATIIGASYSVTFAMSGNMIVGPNEKILMVSAGNDFALFSFDVVANGSTLQDPNWAYYEWTFTAIDTTTTLSFVSQVGSAGGPALDDVSVVLVPAPGTLALLAAGLFTGRRRRRDEGA